MVKVEQVTAVQTHTLLEGPHWEEKTQSLYFVDINESLIFRYDYRENKCYQAKIDGESSSTIGFIVPVKDKMDLFIAGVGARLLIIHWDGKSSTATHLSTYTEVETELKCTQFNDGKVDPRGRVFVGTLRNANFGDIFEARIGSLYKFDNGVTTKLKEKICISNGLTWNKKTNKFYYIDSGDYDIKEYDYNPATGLISNEKVLISFKTGDKKPSSAPDGMTIDENGNLFVAMFNGGKVLKINVETKKIEQEIKIPGASQTTSVIFGGPNLDELFVTSANIEKKPAPAGGLFKITGLGVKGLIGDTAVVPPGTSCTAPPPQ